MPLSELYRLAKRRIDSNQDLEGGNSDVYELVWENGQITTTQGQSSRGRRDAVVTATTTLPSHCLPSYTPKSRERDIATRAVKFGSFSDTVPISEALGLSHNHNDDDMITWLNYPIDHSDYCPEFLPELSGISAVNPNPNPSPVPKANANTNANTNTSTNNVINFSHFSRPIGLARANINNHHSTNNNGNSLLQRMPSIDRMSIKDKDANSPKPKHPEAICESTTGAVPPPLEPVVASSSVCSGNSVERVSDEPERVPKRKFRDAEDSECHSDDVEEESVGVKKTGAGRGSGSKRSRAAEVHNLSERKRRDRINEKMRALQELIPNCNKVDKASMLDEAIEYLKTLQLQVQIMSMGAGLCMPPMMMPHNHHHHMAHFPPMGMGMGLGMGFGMGVPDMMQGGMAGPSLPVYGIPSQGISMLMQRPHLVPPMMAGPFVRPADSPHPYASNIPGSFSNQTSTQCQSVNRVLEKSAMVQNNVQQFDASGSNASGPANGNDPGPSRAPNYE